MTDDTGCVDFSAELFAWKSDSSWHFVRLPLDTAEDLRDLSTAAPRGFGSIRVAVRIGGSAWSTSVFPHKETGSFVLPIKKQVRLAEDVGDGDVVDVVLRPLED